MGNKRVQCKQTNLESCCRVNQSPPAPPPKNNLKQDKENPLTFCHRKSGCKQSNHSSWFEFRLSCRSRSKLFRRDQGDPGGGARQPRRADGLLLHLPGRHVVHPPPRHLRAAAQAHPAPQRPARPTPGGGGPEESGESVHPTAGPDTVTPQRVHAET